MTLDSIQSAPSDARRAATSGPQQRHATGPPASLAASSSSSSSSSAASARLQPAERWLVQETAPSPSSAVATARACPALAVFLAIAIYSQQPWPIRTAPSWRPSPRIAVVGQACRAWYPGGLPTTSPIHQSAKTPCADAAPASVNNNKSSRAPSLCLWLCARPRYIASLRQLSRSMSQPPVRRAASRRSCSYGSRRPPDAARLTGRNIINGTLTVAALLLPVFLLRRPGEAVMLGETTQALMCNLPERYFTGSSWSSN